MKFRTRFLATALTLIIGSTSPIIIAQENISPKAVSPLTIALSAGVNQFHVGSPIPVVITLTNTSKSPVNLQIFLVTDGIYRRLGFQFSLMLDGKAVPQTAFHRNIRGEHLAGDPGVQMAGSLDTYAMAPGLVDNTTIDLRKLFIITQPGSYLFSVKMPQNGDNKVAIDSSPLRLNVVP